jgi:hypothetical protein
MGKVKIAETLWRSHSARCTLVLGSETPSTRCLDAPGIARRIGGGIEIVGVC